MELTTHQSLKANRVLLELYQALEGKRSPFVSLIGPAGSGKTVVTQEIINIIRSDYKVVATAPTHKATKVLSHNLFNTESSTIHSFLKLKLQPDFTTGLQILIEDWDGNAKANNIDILIVDEASMISYEMFEHIQTGISKNKMKVVLFVGDEMQLKPIENSGGSIYDFIKSQELSEIVRQAQENPIIRHSTEIRLMIASKQFKSLDKLFSDIQSEDAFALFTSPNEFMKDYLSNTENDKVICSFTNETVDTYNSYVRGEVKGKDIPYIIQGDELVFQDALSKNKKVLYANNDIVEVQSATKHYNKALDIDTWMITVKESQPFEIIDINSIEKWNDHLKKLKDLASTADAKDKKRLWAFYYETMGKYGKVKYTYASTLHKLQGSTYNDVYFDFRSLKKHTRDLDTMYRLIYVALTRASKRIRILL